MLLRNVEGERTIVDRQGAAAEIASIDKMHGPGISHVVDRSAASGWISLASCRTIIFRNPKRGVLQTAGLADRGRIT